MQNSGESPLVAAQRNAILQIRGRYERGELPFDAFHEALDAVTQARSPEECAAIVRDLPHSHLATLAALESPSLTITAPMAPSPPLAPAATQPRKRITAIMSEAKKTGAGWTLAPHTHVRAFMGAVRLDLRRAQLPEQAYLRVNATMAEVTITVPDDVAVSVRSMAILGQAQALGESVEGVIASGEEEYTPAQGLPRARLTLEVSAVMGSVQVRLASATRAAIADLARDALSAAMESMRRGWERGALPGGQPASLPSANTQPGLPSSAE